jgi:hypothetical protein
VAAFEALIGLVKSLHLGYERFGAFGACVLVRAMYVPHRALFDVALDVLRRGTHRLEFPSEYMLYRAV